MTSFAELTKQMHLINDLILGDMTCGEFDGSKEALAFGKHLLATKYWFARISYANKKKYLLALIHDVRSAWALSLLLKSMWNCRPKDAVMSVSERNVYTSFDQAPMDHNRTAMPPQTLALVMKNDRMWFHTLDPEPQALVLSELTTVAGGPAMWEVLRLAQQLFEQNRDLMLKNIQECIVVNDQVYPQKSRTDEAQNREGGAGDTKNTPHSEAQKALDANLTMWNGTIKSMRDNLKLEEQEMTFNDGTKRKIWKVNRPKPEITETVDFVQLLPSSIGKRIMSYLPRQQLGDYARVNKYWAYLVDELRAELVARTKINADYERLHELLLRHETSLEMFATQNERGAPTSSYISTAMPSHLIRQPQPYSLKPSEKSSAVYSHRQFISEKLTKPLIVQKPIRNMMDLSERLEKRGAADENIWKWCDYILAHAKKHKRCRKIKDSDGGGVLSLGNVHFPCPLMNVSMQIPLDPPMYKDPIMTTTAKPKKIVTDYNLVQAPKDTVKRYNIFTRDLSGLYQVLKIPSYLGLDLKTKQVEKRAP
ncbi:hypothetical protein PYW08_016691 [Mythimna loreyi]|uniref:Uncharacterized protein n=1 Tax=Mythimna loreyi TaxID=667449 RepID=A0ACC2QXZ7_9NEOP|nr:hypothetical protein PYW08_016691 [Mythimna loreyi]